MRDAINLIPFFCVLIIPVFIHLSYNTSVLFNLSITSSVHFLHARHLVSTKFRK